MKTNVNYPTTALPVLAPALFNRGWPWRATLLLTLALGFPRPLVLAQTNSAEDTKPASVVASIAPYSPAIRQAILLASQYPQTLSQLQQNQTQTQQSFQALIGGFNQTKQGWFYELTRYPELMHTLATQPGGKGESAIRLLLPASASDELQTAAWKLYRTHHGDLVQVDNLNQQARQQFDQILQPLDAPVQAAFRQLVSLPDVLGLLTDHLDLTQQLGEEYRANGPALTQELTALHDSLEVQNQYELAAYQNEVASNPQAKQELSQAAQAYAKANGYIIPPVPADDQANTAYAYNYYGNPYSYWFGYPGWYGSPLWYPGSYWANFGFGYSGLGLGFGLFGFPTYGFSNWFFNGGYYTSYPNLYRQFGSYYRNNLAQARVLGSVNSGFMSVAHNHFAPAGSTRLNFLTSPRAFSRPVGPMGGQAGTRMGGFSQPNASAYHAQGWGGYGNSFGRSRFGGGFVGFHGGGRR